MDRDRSTAMDAFREYLETLPADHFCDVVSKYLDARTVDSGRLLILSAECRRRSASAHGQDCEELRDAFLRLEHAILIAAAAFDRSDWFEERS